MEIIVDHIDRTIEIGIQLGTLAEKGDILCLNGDLGAGKTHMAKGIAKGLKIEDTVTSPTFTIVNEYEGRLKLYHFDVYRVNDPDEIAAIGFDEYIFNDGFSVIEWSDYIEELIPRERINIEITKLSELGEDFRKIKITAVGDRYAYIKEIK